jgi:hypothetical protein
MARSSLISGLAAADRKMKTLLHSLNLEGQLEQSCVSLVKEIKHSLSLPAGSADHSTPWRRSGTLHASISHNVEQGVAVVGSTDPIAVDQELGTNKIPPRPFLAPAAAIEAPEIALRVLDHVRTTVEGQR